MEKKELPHNHGEKETLASIQEVLGQDVNFRIIADIFKQLGDTTRLRIFWLLCHIEECVLNIAALMDMSSPAVSHHLRSLKSSGLITSRREGKEVYYRASDSTESQMLHRMIEQVMEVACPEAEFLPDHLNHTHV